jgi:hypothetical protein
MKVTLSRFMSVSQSDLIKGGVYAVVGAVYGVVQGSITAKIFTFDWTSIWQAALTAGIGYIGVKFFTPSPTSVVVDTNKTDVIDAATGKPIA